MNKGKRRLQAYAKRAAEDVFRNFWDGNSEEGHFTGCCDLVLWELGMAVLMMESYYDATKNPEILRYMQAEWRYLQNHFADREMTAPDSPCNPACDDAAWSSMVFMCIYRMTGDVKALDLAAETIRKSYDCWKDGCMENGLWYRFGEDHTAGAYGWIKSVYCAGLVLSALEHYEITQGTNREDMHMLSDTLTLCKWVEEHLRRDGRREFQTEKGRIVTETSDQLYYVDFVDNKEAGIWAPKDVENPQYIEEAGSCSSLFGNTAMAAINIKLYTLFKDEDCLKRGLATANSIPNSPYNNNGVFVNDRDAWTNAAFMRYFVELVLTRPEIDRSLLLMLKNTGIQIAGHCRTTEGFYSPEWSGGNRWTGYPNAHTQTNQLKTSAISVHMIMAAALAEKLGLFQ